MDDNNIFSKNLDLSDSEYSGGSDSDMIKKQNLEEQIPGEQNGLVLEFRDDKETETSGLITQKQPVIIESPLVIKPPSPRPSLPSPRPSLPSPTSSPVTSPTPSPSLPSPTPSPTPSLPSSSSEMIDKPKNTAKQKIINAKIKKNIIAADEKEAKKKGRFINRKRENFTEGKDSITNSLRSTIASKDYVAKKKEEREEKRAAKAEVKKDNRNKKIEYQAKRKADIIEKVENIESKVKENIDAKKTKIGKAFSRGRGEVRKKIAKLDTIDRMNTMYILFNKYLLQPLIIIIVVLIVYYSLKYLMKLYKKYPRSFVLANYLNVSGKYDKSTGLDMELSDILSSSLTDYLVRPSRILATIKINSHSIINENSGATNDDSNTCSTDIEDAMCSDNSELLEDKNMNGNYLNYIKQNLFNNYINNTFYKTLRKFVEHSDNIFNQGYTTYSKDDEAEYKKGDMYSNKYFQKYYDDMKSSPTMNTYLIQFFKNIIKNDPAYMIDANEKIQIDVNEKIENDSTTLFISLLKEKPNVSYEVQFNKSYNSIKKLFTNILTTSSSKLDNKSNVLEYYKNLFLRNVLYNLIIENDVDESSPISKQLGSLESKNILSYIDPDIFDGENEMLNKYGNMLSMTSDNNTKTYFNTIFDGKLPSNILEKINNNSNNSNIEEDYYTDIIDDFKTNFEENYQNIKTNVFSNLKKYKDKDYNIYYNNYKNELNRVTNYNSENSIINKIYNLSNLNGSFDNFPKDFNINKLDEDDIRIIEIFNHFIIFEYFYTNISNIISNNINNTGDNYDNCVKYFYYFESFASLKYLNSESNSYVNVLNEQDSNLIKKINVSIKDSYNSLIGNNDSDGSFISLLDYTLYQRDEDLINCGIFTSLMFYDPDNTNITKKNLLNISKFYFSFVEIKLGSNYISDIKKIKEYRTHWNIKQDFIWVKIKYLFIEIILKKYLWSEFNRDKLLKESLPFWKNVSGKLTNKCTWFTDDIEKEAMKCPPYDTFVVEGFVSAILKIGKAFEGFPKLVSELIALVGKLIEAYVGFWNGLLFIFRFKPFLIGFIIFLAKVTIYIIALLVVVILSFPNLFGLVLGGYVAIKASPLVGIIIGIFTVFLMIFGFSTYTYNKKDYFQVSVGHTIALVVWTIIVALKTTVKIIFVIAIIAMLLILYVIALVMDSVLGDYRFTKFLYKRFFACENEPLSWYRNSRYDLGNKTSRGFFCSLNCGSNHRLSENKAFCERAPSNVPYYCPQPLLYNIYKNERLKGKNKIISFFINNHPDLVYKSPQQRAEFIINYKKNKKEYYESCNANFSNEKNMIAKNVCATGYDTNNKDISNKIKDICKQTYCSNGKYENFCYKYKDETIQSKFKIKDKNRIVRYVKSVFILIIAVFISLYIINELEKNNNIINENSLVGKRFSNMKDKFNKFITS